EAPVAAEHVVNHQEDQIGVEYHQARTPQGLDLDQVEVGRDDQIADELAVLLNLDRADRDFGAAMDVVEQADAQIARKAFVDELHRGHAPAHDALLPSQI